MLSFFKNYKFDTIFYLPITLVDKLCTQISEKKINNRRIRKIVTDILNEKFDTKNKARVTSVFFSKYCIQIIISADNNDFLEKLKKHLNGNTNLYPFWIVFPKSFRLTPLWNEGLQEYYSYHWLPFWVSLKENEQRQYFKKYNASKEWQEWLLEHNEQLKKDYLNKQPWTKIKTY